MKTTNTLMSLLDGMAYEERNLNSLGQIVGKKVTTWQETSVPAVPYSTRYAYRNPREVKEESIVYELV